MGSKVLHWGKPMFLALCQLCTEPKLGRINCARSQKYHRRPIWHVWYVNNYAYTCIFVLLICPVSVCAYVVVVMTTCIYVLFRISVAVFVATFNLGLCDFVHFPMMEILFVYSLWDILFDRKRCTCIMCTITEISVYN